jgi:ABC-type glycerol-3-phosphate transport system substrate-binding protein
MYGGYPLTRRGFMGTTAVSAIAAAVPLLEPSPAFSQASPIELVHWSWLSASDGAIWAQMIDAFNEAHKGKGVSIRLEVIPFDQYVTKLLASSVTGKAPDFGWGDAGLRADMVKNEVVVPLDDLAVAAGLDLADFDGPLLDAVRYRKYGDGIYSIPMDVMSMQPEINLDHVAEAGLPVPEGPGDGPQNGEELLEWAKAMTVRDGDNVARSGIMMTGSGPHPTVTWGIVAHQMGFRRVNDDLTEASINPDAGKAAMQWVLDLFDEHKVATREIADRYKAFGTGEGSIFWTGPWTLNGYVEQGLNFATTLMPQIGDERATFFAMGGLEIYRQNDPGRYEAAMAAIKWISDNSFLWTTVGRGVSPRKSIRARPDYITAGHPWKVRGAFIEGLEIATIMPVPVPTGVDYSIYSGSNFLATTLDGVWAGQTSIDDAMERLTQRWQEGLDKA